MPDGQVGKVLLGMEQVHEQDFSAVHPWMITVAQVDEDEAIDFFVGAYRPTEFYKDNTRPYFLKYKDGVFVRQWTGSYLDHLCFSGGSYVDEDFDGISTLKLDETVLDKGVLKHQVGEFTIRGFSPIRLAP
ncbi:MAG: hypothetical protein Q4A72_03430 [Bacillota bacterium]|nr:hypothetical protein [Bacillota bacterium]